MTRTIHFIRAGNLLYSANNVKKITESCKDCCKLKLQFRKPPVSYLIKVTQPFECLNIDFMGPVLSATNYVYMLTVVDEFSRYFPAFSCKDTSTETVKNVLIAVIFLTWNAQLYTE